MKGRVGAEAGQGQEPGGTLSPCHPVTLSPCHLLVVDDEPLVRDTLAEFLTGEGFLVVPCASGEDALARAAAQHFDIALCDVQLPGIDGLELLRRLQRLSPETFVLLITAYATVENAVEAFQRGAHDYLMKPILLDEVLGKVRRMLRYRDVFQENQDLRRELNRQYDPDQIVGRGPARRVRASTMRPPPGPPGRPGRPAAGGRGTSSPRPAATRTRRCPRAR